MNERDFASDPSRMRDELTEVLREASFAVSVGSRESIRSLTRLESDVEIWERDIEIGDSLYTYSSLTRVGLGRSLLAPLAKFLSRRELRELNASIKPATRHATQKRKIFAHSLGHTPGRGERVWLDHRTDSSDWPCENGVPLTPLEIALSTSAEYAVSLSAYQWEAVAVIEIVRAAGRVLGDRDPDTLANQFQLMILGYGGTQAQDVAETGYPFSVVSLAKDDHLVRGAFVRAAIEGTVLDLEPFANLDRLEHSSARGWWPLSGPDQMLAVTILAAWIRMSRLGVRLSSRQNLEAWPLFFDGLRYGYVPELIGQGWLLDPEENRATSRRYTFFGSWDTSGDPPWVLERGGTPMIFVGIAAKLLHEAIHRVSVLDAIPDDFVLPDDDSPEAVAQFRKANRSQRNPDRSLLELRRIRDRLADSPMGCAYEVRLLDKY